MFNWKRFWKPRDSIQSQVTNIEPPTVVDSLYKNEDLVPFEDMLSYQCMVLLGDPGLGKSTEILRICSFLESQAIDNFDTFRLDLRDYQSDSRLFEEFQRNSDIQKWVNGTHFLQLFLDSLDEGLLTINTLATAIPKELSNLPFERLYLQIACRTADWPQILEGELKKLWGDEGVKAFELTHLSQYLRQKLNKKGNL